MKVNIEKYKEYLVVNLDGTFSLDEAISSFPLVLTTCQQTGLAKVLIDIRQLAGVPAATEKILYVFNIRDQYRAFYKKTGHKLKVAYVGSAPLVSTYQPGNEIAKQENLPFSLFTDKDEALKWLGSEQS